MNTINDPLGLSTVAHGKHESKDYIRGASDQFLLDEKKVKVLIQAERDRAKEEIKQALRNVPVGFVRQWINEDLLKDGHRLVTNEDIQGFINIALTNPQDLTPDRPLNYERD